MKTYAIDTETYYDKNVSTKNLGAEAYTRHPDYYCGMVSIVGPDVRFVGKPQDAPWTKLRGATWVAHNVQFDRWVLNRLWDQGVIPDDVRPSKWRDTTAIPAYLQVSRDLGNAAKVLLGKAPDKSVRTQMSGKHFDQLTPERYQILCDYALTDAALCYELYTKFHNKLPQDEWDLAELTVEQGDYGVQINTRLLEDYLATVQTHQIQLLDQIPWRADKPALSQAALRTQLCADGAGNLPKTTSADDPVWAQWSQQNADRFPYMEAFVQLRRLNKHLSTLQTIQNRLDTGGVLHFSMKYCGARVTGRWAGDAGINMQNLTKGELFGASVRDLFVPRDGHKFIIADLSNIEPRCAAAIAGDTEFLELVGKGMDIYEAYARKALGYKDPRPLKEVDNDLRQRSKVACLAGTTPILTDQGYFTITELQNKSSLRVWDGVEWVSYERIQQTGTREVINLKGEHYTPDHEIFTSESETKSCGSIQKGNSTSTLCRNAPGGNWADVWRLAYFVARTLTEEWIHICKRTVRSMWQRFRC